MLVHRLKRLAQIVRGPSQAAAEPSLPDRNAAAIAAHVRGGGALTWVSSFPRSGNTWVRHLLADGFTQAAGLETGTNLPIHVNRIVPDRYQSPVDDVAPEVPTPGLVVKTHDRFAKAEAVCDSPHPGGVVRHLYIYRRPEDCLTSYYHYHLRYDNLREKAADGPDAFTLATLDRWIGDLESYRDAKRANPERVFLVSYEQLLERAADALLPALGWMGANVTRSQLDLAVEHMAFDKLKAREVANDPTKREERFYRRGSGGGGEEELSPETLAAIADRTDGLLREMASLGSGEPTALRAAA